MSGHASRNHWLGSKAWVQARGRPFPYTSRRDYADTSSSSAIQLWSCYVGLVSTMSPITGPCWNLIGFQAHPSSLEMCPRWAWGLPVSASCIDRAEGVQLRQDMSTQAHGPQALPFLVCRTYLSDTLTSSGCHRITSTQRPGLSRVSVSWHRTWSPSSQDPFP